VTGSRDTTVILWRIHQTGSLHKKNAPEPPPTTPATPRSPLSSSTSSVSNLSETRRHRIEGPMHVIRGHLREVTCCAVSPDLGVVASSSDASGVLLHSLRTGRLIRRLDVAEAHAVSLSSQGIILVWNESKKTLSTFTVNGLPIATSVLLPFSGQISCIEISREGNFALIGTSMFHKMDGSSEFGAPYGKDDVSKDSEIFEAEQRVHVPSICFVDLHKLQVNI
jgi:WD40 repeat protein